jgi:recombination protein RecR
MNYPESIEKLSKLLSQLPSVGPKTAERYVFFLLNNSKEELLQLSNTIKDLKDKIKNCSRCNTFTEKDPCLICQDNGRDNKQICLVENTQDLWTIEDTQQFTGKYFVLGRLIDPISGINPENLPIKQFLNLIEKEKIQEIIIALNFTMEGESTTLYLKKYLPKNIKITRLAKGLPLGSDLEYADSLTLKNALKYRQNL